MSKKNRKRRSELQHALSAVVPATTGDVAQSVATIPSTPDDGAASAASAVTASAFVDALAARVQVTGTTRDFFAPPAAATARTDDGAASVVDDVTPTDAAAAHDAVAVDDAVAVHDLSPPAPEQPPIGARLRAAREALGYTREDVARATHLSTAVVIDIENENFTRAGAPIYLRGYLRSYARAVHVPEVVIDTGLRRLEADTPALMPSHGARARPDLITRYWNPLAYAALTAVVIVPVWFLLQPLLVTGSRAPDLAPLDAPRAELLNVPVGVRGDETRPAPSPVTVPNMGPPATLAGDPAAVSPATAAAQRPLMASMAPMPESPAAGVGSTVTLRLSLASWVEFVGDDGRRIEWALLPAGTVRDYQVAGRADLRIGNVRGATLTIDGHAVDLRPYARANVARITVGDSVRAQ